MIFDSRDEEGRIVLALIAERDAARVEVERLRLALEQIQHWDMLNPPRADVCSDLPWLRRFVDTVLEGNAS